MTSWWLALWLIALSSVATALPVEEVRGINLLSAIRVGHPRLSFTRTTTTFTQTYISTQWLPSVVCARLVNITGPCRRFSPEGRLAEMEEPVVMTFDEDMNEADDLMHFNPTMTLKVETTAAPHDLESTATLRLEASKRDITEEDGSPETRANLGQAVINFFNVNRIEKTTVTEISTTSIPFTTKTVFIMNCTPEPFSAFPICARGPRRPTEFQ